MDSFFIDNVKTEKAIAMKRYQRFRKIADVFRYIFEISVLLILFAWISTRLPATLGDIFRDFSSLFISPRFMFVVGNAIILTLFAKSGQFSSENSSTGTGNGNVSSTDFYDEFVKNSVSREKFVLEISSPVQEIVSEPSSPPLKVSSSPLKVYEDKEILMEENSSSSASKMIMSNSNPEIDIHAVPTVPSKNVKKYQRSQSEKTNQKEKPKQKELRRWKTERSREEEMSNEEFNRTIEAFIAKQVKFIREESMAIVAQN